MKQYYIQSILFPVSNFSLDYVYKWIIKHKYSLRKITLEDNFYRLRQYEPKYLFLKGFHTIKTIILNNGIHMIIYYPSIKKIYKSVLRGGSLSTQDMETFITNGYAKSKLDNIGEFINDKELSTPETQIYHNFNTNQTVMNMRGTTGLSDWVNNVSLALGQYRHTKRFKDIEAIHDKVASKYGIDNLTLLSHSQTAAAGHMLADKAKEHIMVNPAIIIQHLKPNEYVVRSQRDLVSALVPYSNYGNPNITTVKSSTYNPFKEHSVSILGRLQNINIGYKWL